jgi:hypothetical protein
VTAKKRPAADPVEAIRAALRGIVSGADLGDVVVGLEPLHPRNNLFPGEVLLELAADALERSGVSREDPVEYEGIWERYLPEHHFSGKTEHHKSHYALRAVAMVRAGMTPDLLAEVSWWRANDLWIWSWYALVIFVRVAVERTGDSVALVCERIAARHGVDLGAAG